MNVMKLFGTGSDALLGRWLRLPLRLLPGRTMMPVLTGLNKGYKWRAGSSINQCWVGNYEVAKQRVLTSLVRPGMTAFDVGANAGFYTLAFSRLVGSTGRVFAFEPFCENARNILHHININNCRNATLYQTALSSEVGTAAFNVRESNAMGSIGGDTSQYIVPTTTIDALVESGVPCPDIVKMDVEGAELMALTGARSVLARKRTIWIVAFHSAAQIRGCGQILHEAGYRLYRMDGSEIFGGNVDVDEVYALP